MYNPKSDTSILNEAYELAGEIMADIVEAIEAEVIPLFYSHVTEADIKKMDMTPELINSMAIEVGHDPFEEAACPACQMIASRYNLPEGGLGELPPVQSSTMKGPDQWLPQTGTFQGDRRQLMQGFYPKLNSGIA